jgi:hypothetical protein
MLDAEPTSGLDGCATTIGSETGLDLDEPALCRSLGDSPVTDLTAQVSGRLLPDGVRREPANFEVILARSASW